MKNFWVRKCAVLLVAFVLGVTFAGCGGTEQKVDGTSTLQATTQAVSTQAASGQEASDKIDTSKQVDLIMYLVGDPPKDTQKVYDEVNKLLLKDINARLELQFMSWDYEQKYDLIISSGEEFDLIFSANWIDYAGKALKGAYLELKPDMIEKYMPATYADEPEAAWKQAEVDGKVYMVPMSYKEFPTLGFFVRGDLRQKYGIPEIKTLDDFGKYLDAAKEEGGLIPYDMSVNFDGWMLQRFISDENNWRAAGDGTPASYALDDPEVKVFDMKETPQYRDFVLKMREWNEKGYWSKSALVNKTPAKDSFLNGKSAACILNLLTANSLYSQVMSSHPEWKPEYFEASNGKAVIVNPYISNGMSINANSQNPERAMMLLDLFRNDEAYFNLTTYGIKGVHYDLTEDGKLKRLGGEDNGFPVDGACPWGWRTDKLYKTSVDGLPNFDAIKNTWTGQIADPALANFNFNDSNIKNEMAALKNVYSQFQMPLELGFIENPEKGLEEMLRKQKEAGSEKIMQELETQVEAFLKNSR